MDIFTAENPYYEWLSMVRCEIAFRENYSIESIGHEAQNCSVVRQKLFSLSHRTLKCYCKSKQAAEYIQSNEFNSSKTWCHMSNRDLESTRSIRCDRRKTFPSPTSSLISQLHSIIVNLSSYLRWFKQPGPSSMQSYILQEKCVCRADASTEAIP